MSCSLRLRWYSAEVHLRSARLPLRRGGSRDCFQGRAEAIRLTTFDRRSRLRAPESLGARRRSRPRAGRSCSTAELTATHNRTSLPTRAAPQPGGRLPGFRCQGHHQRTVLITPHRTSARVIAHRSGRFLSIRCFGVPQRSCGTFSAAPGTSGWTGSRPRPSRVGHALQPVLNISSRLPPDSDDVKRTGEFARSPPDRWDPTSVSTHR